MAPTAVDMMANSCSVGFKKVDLVCNIEEESRTRTRSRTDQINHKKSSWSIDEFYKVMSRIQRTNDFIVLLKLVVERQKPVMGLKLATSR